MLHLRHFDPTGLIQLAFPEKSLIAERHIRELQLGEDSLLVSVRRHGKLRMIRGGTVLQAGDQVPLFAEEPRAESLRMQLLAEAPGRGHKSRHPSIIGK